MHTQNDELASPANTASATSSEPSVRLNVKDLLMGAREAVLEHDGQDYRLRITASGKLLLTK